MAIQYTDGEFSETLPIDEALEQFKTELPTGKVAALHVGLEEQIEEAKRKADLSARIDALEAAVKPKSDLIDIPTEEELRRLSD